MPWSSSDIQSFACYSWLKLSPASGLWYLPITLVSFSIITPTYRVFSLLPLLVPACNHLIHFLVNITFLINQKKEQNNNNHNENENPLEILSWAIILSVSFLCIKFSQMMYIFWSASHLPFILLPRALWCPSLLLH